MSISIRPFLQPIYHPVARQKNTAAEKQDMIRFSSLNVSSPVLYSRPIPRMTVSDYVRKYAVGRTMLEDRKTGQPIEAIITRKALDDTVLIKLFENKKSAYPHLGCILLNTKPKVKSTDPIIREYQEAVKNPAINDYHEKALEVFNLASTAGDRIRGIGTRLMEIAFKESLQHGFEGRIYLYAENAISNTAVTYRSEKDSPVPFYHKLGFSTADEALDRTIYDAVKDMKQHGYYDGPQTAEMILPEEEIAYWKEELGYSHKL